MALINRAKKEINAKIVYAGPGEAGKESSLQFIYRKLRAEFRGTLKSARLHDDTMLFFDFMPPSEGSVQGYSVRFHLYTLPGELTDTVSWKMLLKGVDGIVFVADLSASRLGQDRASLDQLQELLTAYDKGLTSLPLVVQANKRDRAEAVSLDELRQAIGRADLALIPASTVTGEGVLESLFQVVKAVLKDLRSSGLTLGTPPERVDSSTEPPRGEGVAPSARESQPADNEPLYDIPPVREPVPDRVPPLHDEPRSEVPAVAAERPAVAAVPGISVSFAAAPELVGGSEIAIPLVVTVGAREERVTLTLALSRSLEQGVDHGV